MKPADKAAPSEPLVPWDNAYAHWSRALWTTEPDGAAPVMLQPALVRLRTTRNGKASKTETDPFAAARQVLAKAIEERALILDAVDADTGQTALATDNAPFLVYWPDSDPARIDNRFGTAIEVLQLGRRVGLSRGKGKPGIAARNAKAAKGPVRPIVAVIDDGIGFLNARFRRLDAAVPGGTRTRFHAVWLQAFRTIAGAAGGYVQAGRVLRRAEIDAMLAAGDQLEEDVIYRGLNADLLEPGAHRSSEMSFSLGTAILDTAAGADPMAGDPVSDWPLLAVQLPPEAVDNTAGTQLEPMLVQAVRWCLRQARHISTSAPIVINISFATFAGPKDGTKAVEALIAHAVDAWETATGRPARVVLSWGNARRTRQAARMMLQPGVAQALHWCQPPDDYTASYLELRADAPADLARLTLRVTPPGTNVAQTLAPMPANSSRKLFDGRGNHVGRLYHIGRRTTAPGVISPAHLVLAMAPTIEDGMRPVTPHGAWGLSFAAGQGSPVALRLEVQRDDTVQGYRLNGRQSYLDHPLAEGWDTETLDYGAPEAAGPITRAGTHSSFATAPSPRVLTVAAAVADGLRPARYSAEGAPWVCAAPDLAAIADRGPATPGRNVAGTFTGSRQMLDGTSVAAAQVTRELARMLGSAAAMPIPGPAEIAALIAVAGQPATPADAARLGAGVIIDPELMLPVRVA